MTVCPVTVNNNSSAPTTRKVYVMPLSRIVQPPVAATVSCSDPMPPVHVAVIGKVILKAVSKDKESHSKVFHLRNINAKEVLFSGSLRSLIRSQLQDDIISEHFDVGFMNGNNCVSIRSQEDLEEVWSNIQKGVNVVLWCDGYIVEELRGDWLKIRKSEL